MSAKSRMGAIGAALLCVLLAGCGGGAAPPAGVLQPLGQVAVEAEPEAVAVEPEPEPDPRPRERWQSPFAVSAVGRPQPAEPRRIVVIGVDPSIAAGLEEQEEVGRSIRQRAEEREQEGGSRPGSSDRPGETEPPGARSRFHEVGAEETLSAIARRYNVSPEQIRTLNRLTDDRVRPGERLLIPGTD